ncbi:TAXI family TRAP transporter solute-binding subunit [Psychrobacter lutiphocae]|uniref:TAXI family TRAP transporter solute-binding subunit n=1 Tax=Psychrobacter lutiphocae TaxID=540500 RepID=UPI0003789611|nr:TAXI family TRAP transporter solute-binding subunit [Psychrobacter lutiphocae]
MIKKTFKTKGCLLVSGVLLSTLALTACSNQSDSSKEVAGEATTVSADKLETKFVTVATGGASGPYNIIATSLTEAYNATYGVNSKTQTTGASVENMNLIDQGKVEMAFAMSDVVNDAVLGRNNFSAPITKVQQIAALYPNYVQVVTSQKSGIKNFEDLRGKRIAVGAQNSGVEVNARNLLQGFGMTYDDVKVDYLGYAEAADALKSGKLDAAFLTSGLPNSSLMELQQGFDLQLVSIDPAKVAEIAQNETYFTAKEIPAGTYGNETAIPTAAIMNALVVSSDLSEGDVYKLTKTFFESLDKLKTAHQAAADISLENAQQGMVAPIHPGAKKYYDEQATQ